LDDVRGPGQKPGASLITQERLSLYLSALDDVAGDICSALRGAAKASLRLALYCDDVLKAQDAASAGGAGVLPSWAAAQVTAAARNIAGSHTDIQHSPRHIIHHILFSFIKVYVIMRHGEH